LTSRPVNALLVHLLQATETKKCRSSTLDILLVQGKSTKALAVLKCALSLA
jgi:hypothetical protein